MRRGTSVCGAEELDILQQIFQAVWLHLERMGKVHRDDDGVRNWVAARVIACAKDCDLLDVQAIKLSVLRTLHS
jgi:hypothetical protein